LPKLTAADCKVAAIAIDAVVVDFYPTPTLPLVRGGSKKKFTNDARIAISSSRGFASIFGAGIADIGKPALRGMIEICTLGVSLTSHLAPISSPWFLVADSRKILRFSWLLPGFSGIVEKGTRCGLNPNT
jgi:hypothetical protein